jgi:pimeloyl-ACP methyl ester carboxylesterase
VTFLLVPGAWLGGWCWRDVASTLRTAGHDTIPITLTGLGERAHLLTSDIGLQTHVSDLLGLLRYRDLWDVTLVGHSYGGTVITAVAELAPKRIRRLVYLDATVPQDGQSNNDVLGLDIAKRIRESACHAGDGWRVPPPSIVDWHLPEGLHEWVEHKLTPHPLRCLEEPFRLRSREASSIERVFLRSSVQSALYGRLMDRARQWVGVVKTCPVAIIRC